jgi:hypothetical protein
MEAAHVGRDNPVKLTARDPSCKADDCPKTKGQHG